MPDETELDFLNDLNALTSQCLEEHSDPWQALRSLAEAVRRRIEELEAEADGA